MEFEIKYSNIKHWRVKINSEWKMIISIPVFKKNDEKFKNELIEKWKQLAKRANLQKFQIYSQDTITIFWEQIKKDTIKWDIKKYLKNLLLQEVKYILDKYCWLMKKKYDKITIKNFKSKWGSCSSSNNISINLNLIHLPYKYLKYVVIHETCHLKHRNHSKDFRNLVKQFSPEYKKIRKELKKICF